MSENQNPMLEPIKSNHEQIIEALDSVKKDEENVQEPTADVDPNAAPDVEETVEPTAEAEAENEAATETDENEQPDENDEVFIVKVNGQETEVTLNQLLESHQKTESSEAKFKEAAQIKKNYNQKIRETDEVYQALSTELQAIVQTFSGPQPGSPEEAQLNAHLTQLEKENPAAWIEYKKDLEQKKVLAEQAQAKQQQINQVIYQREAQLLGEAIPEWVENPDTRTADIQKIQSHAAKYGFAPEEVTAILDHRLVVLLRDAVLGQENDNTNSIIRKRADVKNPPRALGGGDTPRVTSSSQKKIEAEIKRLEGLSVQLANENKPLEQMKVATQLLQARRKLG